jgi:hypothetical protein
MHAVIRWVTIAGLLPGCDTGDTVGPADAATGARGLVVEWSSVPEPWPGQLPGGVTLERAILSVDSLRVVGDAGPGDPRTTANDLVVRWDDNSVPDASVFESAPVGLYSQLSLRLDGGVSSSSIELRGTVALGGNAYEFHIEDTEALSVNLSIDRTLQPGAPVTLRMRVDFASAIAGLDFAAFDEDSGRLELDTGDAQMALFRQRLVTGFSIDDGGGQASAIRSSNAL